MKRRGTALITALAVCLPSLCEADPGNLISWFTNAQNELTFTCQTAVVRLDILDTNVARVYMTTNTLPFSTNTSFTVIKNWLLPPFTVTDSGTLLTVVASGLSVDVFKTPFRFAFLNPDGTVLLSDTNTFGLGIATNAASANFNMPASEQYYGGGLIEGYPLSYHGQQRTLYNAYTPFDGGYMPNLPVPLIISSMGYGVFFDNTFSQSWDFNNTSGTQWLVVVNGGQMNYYFIAGGSISNVLDSYTQMTGRAPLPPRWTCGYIQSKYGYQNWNQVDSAADSFRTNDLPCDTLVLDYFWFGASDQMGGLQWDSNNFPNASLNIASLGAYGFKVMNIHEPYINNSTPPAEANFNQAASLQYLMTTGFPVRTTPSTVNGWYGTAGYVDFNNPAAGAWWFSKLQTIINDGVAAHWTDLGEPEEDNVGDYSYDDRQEAELHNVYSLLWHRDLAAGYATNYPNQRLFIFSRAGFAGDQRYGVGNWTSDSAANWETLAAHENALCDYGMSGLNLFGTDIGGYSGIPTDELYIRWFEFGAFIPVFRAHGDVNDYPTKPVAPYEFDNLVEDDCRNLMKLRYRLIPYIYTAERATFDTGQPVCRALPLAFPNDGSVLQNGTQYMFGPSIMVAPITGSNLTSRSVYLPAGNWIDLWSGQALTGPVTTNWPGPLSQIPAFYADNSIVPLGPYVASTEFDDGSQRALRVYCSSSAGATLYDDDGASNGYSTNAFATTAITADNFGNGITVQIDGAVGTYNGQPAQRQWGLEIYCTNQVLSVVADGVVLAGLPNNASLEAAISGYCLDAAEDLLRVKLPSASVTQLHVISAYFNLPAPPPWGARIDAGGNPYLDHSGGRWTGDQPYVPGSFGWINGTNFDSPNHIVNTIDPRQYQTERYGTNFTYQFDAPNGTYEITLLDADTYDKTPRARLFNVFIDGQLVLTNFDIVATAGGENIATSVVLTNTITTGQIAIQFVGTNGTNDPNARISAIAVRKIADPDSVGDGIPDWWRALYFGGSGTTTTRQSCASCDADGTGQDNLTKFVAGLNPINPASALAIPSAQPSGYGLALDFTSELGNTYFVESTTNLVGGVWTILTNNIPGTGGIMTFLDANWDTVPQKFYRIGTGGSQTALVAGLPPTELAADSAADPAYIEGWFNGADGGTGLGPWTFVTSVTNSSEDGFFVGTSTGNAGISVPGINTDGQSWGLYANSGNTSVAYRAIEPLATGPALSAGATFQIDMDNGWINGPSGAQTNLVGFALRHGNATAGPANYNTGARLQFYFVGGANDYTVVDSGGAHNTGVGFTGTGLQLAVSLGTNDAYTLTIIDNASGNTNATVSGTLAGTAGSSIDSIALFNNNAGNGPNYDLFFNSLEVIGP
ncbi:MAG: TIM-barrel domain-containing protein [Verrucomicrobiia bacterium]